jgi:hypothetical protein
MHRDIAHGMATLRDGQQEQGDWFDLNYEQTRLQPADSPVASPAAVGWPERHTHTERDDLQAKNG